MFEKSVVLLGSRKVHGRFPEGFTEACCDLCCDLCCDPCCEPCCEPVPHHSNDQRPAMPSPRPKAGHGKPTGQVSGFQLRNQAWPEAGHGQHREAWTGKRHENPQLQHGSRMSRKVHRSFTEGSRKVTIDLCAVAGSGAAPDTGPVTWEPGPRTRDRWDPGPGATWMQHGAQHRAQHRAQHGCNMDVFKKSVVLLGSRKVHGRFPEGFTEGLQHVQNPGLEYFDIAIWKSKLAGSESH